LKNSVSDPGKSVSQPGKPLSQLGKSFSDLGKRNSGPGKSISDAPGNGRPDVEKPMFFCSKSAKTVLVRRPS
jgi:hypothetical protein